MTKGVHTAIYPIHSQMTSSTIGLKKSSAVVEEAAL